MVETQRKGGRHGVENPKRNIITFKVSDDEQIILDVASNIFENRSEMIRTLLFDFIFALDPLKMKEFIDPEHFERLKSKIYEEQDENDI